MQQPLGHKRLGYMYSCKMCQEVALVDGFPLMWFIMNRLGHVYEYVDVIVIAFHVLVFYEPLELLFN